jgi:hypothetical protein
MDANIADHASRHGYTNTAYSAHTNEVTLPPLRRVPRNYPSDVQMAAPILPPVIQYPQIVNNIPRTRTCCLCRRWIIIGLCISIMFIVPLAIGLGVGLSNPKTTSSLKTTTSPRFRFPGIFFSIIIRHYSMPWYKKWKSSSNSYQIFRKRKRWLDSSDWVQIDLISPHKSLISTYGDAFCSASRIHFN